MSKAYFVHIPKTAGNSIRQCLRAYHVLANEGYIKSQRVHHFGSRNATRVLNSHLSFTTPLFPCYLDDPLYTEADCSFTVVRNPFDMLVSYYSHYIKSPKKNWIDRGWANVNGYHNFKTFEEFINFFCSCSPEEWHVPQLNRNLFGQIFNDNEEPCVKYAIYLENLKAGTGDLVELLTGRRCPVNLPMKNMSPTRGIKDYRDFYNPELRKLVEIKCEWELRVFKYDFNNKSTRTMVMIEDILG